MKKITLILVVALLSLSVSFAQSDEKENEKLAGYVGLLDGFYLDKEIYTGTIFGRELYLSARYDQINETYHSSLGITHPDGSYYCYVDNGYDGSIDKFFYMPYGSEGQYVTGDPFKLVIDTVQSSYEVYLCMIDTIKNRQYAYEMNKMHVSTCEIVSYDSIDYFMRHYSFINADIPLNIKLILPSDKKITPNMILKKFYNRSYDGSDALAFYMLFQLGKINLVPDGDYLSNGYINKTELLIPNRVMMGLSPLIEGNL